MYPHLGKCPLNWPQKVPICSIFVILVIDWTWYQMIFEIVPALYLHPLFNCTSIKLCRKWIVPAGSIGDFTVYQYLKVWAKSDKNCGFFINGEKTCTSTFWPFLSRKHFSIHVYSTMYVGKTFYSDKRKTNHECIHTVLLEFFVGKETCQIPKTYTRGRFVDWKIIVLFLLLTFNRVFKIW